MPAELRPDADGWECPEHPSYAPTDLGRSHALNSMAKHNRDHHDAAAAELEILVGIIMVGHPDDVLEMAQAIQAAGFVQVPF